MSVYRIRKSNPSCLTSVEGQVGHKSTRAVLHPQSLLLSVPVLAHIHDDVDKSSRLGDLPVKTGSIVGGPSETQYIRTLPLVVGVQ